MGALPEQTSEFGFGGSLSEKEDSWLSSSGLGTLHNCVQDKTGALEKHPGYVAFPTNFRNGDSLATGGTIMDVPYTNVGPRKLLKRGDLVAGVDNGLLYAKNDEWTLQGRVSPWVCEQRTVCQVDAVTPHFDCCCSGDWIYSAFETHAGSIQVAVTYAPSDETVVVLGGNGATGSNVPSSGINEPRIVAIDATGTAILFYMSGTQGKYHVVTPAGIGVAANITLKAGYDVVSDPVGHVVWTVLMLTSVTVESDRYTYAAGALSISATTSVAATAVNAVTLTVDVANNRIVFGWADSIETPPASGIFAQTLRAKSMTLNYGAVNWATRNIWTESSPAGILGGHQLTNLGAASSPFDGHFFTFNTDFSVNGSGAVGHWVSATGVVEGGGGIADPGDINAPLARVCSRPAWDVATQRMFCLSYGDIVNERRVHLVLGVEPRSAAGKASPHPLRFGVLGAFSYLTAGAILFGEYISRPFQDANGNWHLQSLELGGQGATLQLLCDYTLFADERVGEFAELGKATYITGAVLSQWDGKRVCEAGFFYDPIEFLSATATTGGSMRPGDYVYAVTYGRMTATGELVRSRPSLSQTITVPAGTLTNTVTMAARMPGPSNLTNEDFETVTAVEFWRSDLGTTAPLYLVGRTYVNILISADVTFLDTTAGNAGKEQLYSDGTNGEIANTPPASPLSMCQWRNRLWMTDGEQIYYTKEAAATRAAEWSQVFFAVSRGAPKRLTAVAPLGEVLIAFAEDSTSYVYGDGPGADGSGSTLVGPMPAITELGCMRAAGIAQLPDGLLVPTRRGLQLLSGKREYAYIGAAIETTLAAFPRVRCARHISGTNRVWISLANEALTDGVVVLYDTLHKTFGTVFTHAESFGLDIVPCSSIDVNGVHSFSAERGDVYDQSATSFCLTKGAVVLKYGQQIETPWFKGSGPSAELRARRFILLAKLLGTSSLLIEIAYDFSDTYHYSISTDPTTYADMEGNPDTFQLRIPFPRQRCQSYRMRFTELPPFLTGESAGFRFVALHMTTSLRPGSGKLLSKNNSPAAFAKV